MSMAMKYAMKKRMAKGGTAECMACKGGTCMEHGGEMLAMGGAAGDVKNAYHALERHRAHQERKYGEPAKTSDRFEGQSAQDRAKSDKLSRNRASATSAASEEDVDRAIDSYPKKMAHGGDVDGDDDLVMRIMKKRYAVGGEVEPLADFESNDFDELDKDPPEEFHETGANSGDEDGNEALDEEDDDIVKRVMKSRAKKDKMPRPA